MHVLHVIDGLGLGGGAEESLVAMLPPLRDQGINGSVVCLYARDGHEERLRSKGFDVRILHADGILDGARKVRAEINRQCPDLVHASLIRATFATRLACLGLPFAQLNSLVNATYDPLRLHHSGAPPWKLRLLLIMDRGSSRWVDSFHALTETVAQEAREVLRIPAEKVTVIPRGRARSTMGYPTKERRQVVRDSLGIAQDEVVILNVGRHAPQKAKLDLVSAVNRFGLQHKNAVLLIAGREGPSTSELQRAIADSPDPSRIRLLGHRNDIPDLLSASDLFVMPSLWEGLGGSLIEALAMGVPIVGSDAPAIREVLGNGEFGVVVPRRNVHQLAEAMRSLLDAPSERERLSAIGRERYEQLYALDHVVSEMTALYKSLNGSNNMHGFMRDATRKIRSLIALPLRTVVTYGFNAETMARQKGEASTMALKLTRVANAEEYAEWTNRAPWLSDFGYRRLHNGATLWILTRGHETLSTAWTTSPGQRVHFLEIRRWVPLHPDQAALFDLQTPSNQRGRGFAGALIQRISNALPLTLLAWTTTENRASRQVFTKVNAQELGIYRPLSRDLVRLHDRLRGIGAEAAP